MDSCTEEDQEEFFETLEVIPGSSPSSESESGGDDSCRKPAAMAKASVESQQVLLSKYEIWQNDTSSIIERRQRLFTQMGLRLEREDSKRALVFLETSEQRSLKNQDKVVTGSRNQIVGFVNPMDGPEDQQASIGSGYDVSQESHNDNHGVLSQNVYRSNDLFGRLGRSGTSFSPAQTCGGSMTQVDDSITLLRSVSSGHSQIASSFGNNNGTGRSIDIARSSSVQEGAFLNQFHVGLHDHSPDFASLSEEECTVPSSQIIGQAGGIPSNGNTNMDLFCRIKDLDSGKEFVVKTGGKDDLWNKVKELETGRELTLEEFESSLGFSPIVQEVMKRERASDDSGAIDVQVEMEPGNEKKKRAWFKAIKGFVNSSRDKSHHKSGSSGRVSSLEKPGRRSSSESNDSRESPPQLAKRVKVHARRKSTKDFTDLYLRQEIQAHVGAIWTMKFSFDGSFLASAGQDKVVRVWQVVEHDRGGHLPSDISGDSLLMVETTHVDNPLQCHNHLKGSVKESSTGVSSPCWSSKPFFLLEKPKHAFLGHKEDVLDLSWSKSQLLLSSSMDKTVRLWNVISGECVRIFAHNDYVTCIQFNPVDDGYFISGSLDGKVRIWSIKDRQVVDWVDLCEMVTAACYTQNGQGAVVGSYKGTCHLYKTSDSKLQFDTKFEVQRKRKRRSQGKKKITGFQVVPGDEGKILITSSDSRIRVYDGSKVCSKYIGLRNSNSQISASFSSNGMYVICASEDSRVCIWKYYDASLHSAQKQKSLSSISQDKCELERTCRSSPDAARNGESVPADIKEHECDELTRTSSHLSEQKSSCLSGRETSSEIVASPMLDSYLEDCCSALSKAGHDEQNGSRHAFSLEGGGSSAWPEDSLPSPSFDRNSSHENKRTFSAGEDVTVDKRVSAVTTAWGLVIVTAGLGGEIQVFQNQCVPV
ncbi:hypothetical protein GOP47_0010656 [Adiantum capillus-veneris]|uniref:Uncharacterized protein n=1 Tax=Adiantum capillus-veneris TaxID=13818 RepID=A0A9D4ZJ03_ADICA|nr:hypothetical protein GOP47_0010656 [Adiantum capillus-veneris]